MLNYQRVHPFCWALQLAVRIAFPWGSWKQAWLGHWIGSELEILRNHNESCLQNLATFMSTFNSIRQSNWILEVISKKYIQHHANIPWQNTYKNCGWIVSCIQPNYALGYNFFLVSSFAGGILKPIFAPHVACILAIFPHHYVFRISPSISWARP